MVYEAFQQALKRLQTPFNRSTHWRKVAHALKLSKHARQRLAWMIYYETKAQQNASLTCRHFGIAPKVFYTWKKRFDPIGIGLSGKVLTPNRRWNWWSLLGKQRSSAFPLGFSTITVAKPPK